MLTRRCCCFLLPASQHWLATIVCETIGKYLSCCFAHCSAVFFSLSISSSISLRPLCAVFFCLHLPSPLSLAVRSILFLEGIYEIFLMLVATIFFETQNSKFLALPRVSPMRSPRLSLSLFMMVAHWTQFIKRWHEIFANSKLPFRIPFPSSARCYSNSSLPGKHFRQTSEQKHDRLMDRNLFFFLRDATRLDFHMQPDKPPWSVLCELCCCCSHVKYEWYVGSSWDGSSAQERNGWKRARKPSKKKTAFIEFSSYRRRGECRSETHSRTVQQRGKKKNDKICDIAQVCENIYC